MAPEPLLGATQIAVSFGTVAEAQLKKRWPRLPLDVVRQEVVRLTGLKTNDVVSGTIDVVADDYDGTVTITGWAVLRDTTIASMSRELRFDGDAIELYNAYFELERTDASKKGGGGTGTAFLLRTVETARRLGVDVITTYAARSYKYNGYYTWPRLGYNGPLSPKTIAALQRSDLAESVRSAKTLHELMTTPAGRDWWRVNGEGATVTFDPDPASESSHRLDDYWAEKQGGAT